PDRNDCWSTRRRTAGVGPQQDQHHPDDQGSAHISMVAVVAAGRRALATGRARWRSTVGRAASRSHVATANSAIVARWRRLHPIDQLARAGPDGGVALRTPFTPIPCRGWSIDKRG